MPADANRTPMTATRLVRRASGAEPSRVDVDICVIGSGAAGISAALEAAKLGRKVALIDSLPALGGQAVNSIIGTFCGFFSNGLSCFQTVHGIADGILRDLDAKGALHFRRTPHTTVVMYDEIALSRWIEEEVRKAGITVVLGAVISASTRPRSQRRTCAATAFLASARRGGSRLGNRSKWTKCAPA